MKIQEGLLGLLCKVATPAPHLPRQSAPYRAIARENLSHVINNTSPSLLHFSFNSSIALLLIHPIWKTQSHHPAKAYERPSTAMPTILIVGATRGLGAALANLYASSLSNTVFGTTRSASNPTYASHAH
jgi:hypothetical protein